MTKFLLLNYKMVLYYINVIRKPFKCIKWFSDHIYGRHSKHTLKMNTSGTSLVVQWLRIHLPMQGTQVQALVQEDPTCQGATKPMRHNY